MDERYFSLFIERYPWAPRLIISSLACYLSNGYRRVENTWVRCGITSLVGADA